MIRFVRTGAGLTGMSGTTAAPSRTARMRILAVESRCCGPPCRKLRTNPATPVQVSHLRQWRAECPTELSARRFQLSGHGGMRTGAVTAGRTCSDIPVAVVSRAAL